MNSQVHSSSLWLLILILFSLPIFSQEPLKGTDLRKHILSDPRVKDVTLSPELGTASMIFFKQDQPLYNKGEAVNLLAGYLQMRPGIDKMETGRQTKVKNGFEVSEYQQYFKGIKVDHASFKAFTRNDKLIFFNGAYYDIPSSLAVTPVLSESSALNFAKQRVNASKYAWEQVEEMINRTNDLQLKQALRLELDEYLPHGELVIVKDFTQSPVIVSRLAYKFNIYAAEPLSRAWIYVDAINGNILLIDKIIKHVDGKGTGTPATTSVDATVHTRYAGVQVIKTKQVSGNDPNSGQMITSSHPATGSDIGYSPGSLTYVLIDDTRGNGIETYDLNGIGGLPINVAPVYSLGKSFTDVGNNWDSVEHARGLLYDGANEAENDDIAWDAHWGAEVVYDYWMTKHNRLSFDNNNAKIKNFIHYGPAYDNAFWNGSTMTYGDGSGPAAQGFKALTSLDVCGHEIGHGVCEFTSNLVYANESGAMNEGLSDIWAACIEYFAMKRPGSTVPDGKYRTFYVGEQIGANYDAPLRRMDNPKFKGDPDTYGGINWANPNCSPPSLANDQCGVHTNSGVLNHWFFLMTAGSLLGTRPAGLGVAPYYFADSDDELRDAPGLGNGGGSYRVNGLGFETSEIIVYIMETLLSPNATYAEARQVSIAIAQALSHDDPCSPLVESVTNAWYAVGVGNAFASPCVITYGFIFQPGFRQFEAGLTFGCNAQQTFDVPVLLPANSTASFTTGGTATDGQDYSLSTTLITNASASRKQDTLKVFIKNDAVIENDETIILNVAVTNTGSNPVNTVFTLTVGNDDVIPVIGVDSITLLTQTFTQVDGFGEPPGWIEIMQIPETAFSIPANPTPTGKNQWGVFNNQLSITGKVFLTNTTMPGGLYNNLSESKTLIRTPLIDARGLNNLRLSFDYTVQGEVDVQNATVPPDVEHLPVFDYMIIQYSFDGVNFTELSTGPFKPFASAALATGRFRELLPAFLENKEFYLAFLWYNDTNAGGPLSITMDNLVLKGLPRKIEQDLDHEGLENIGPSQDVYIYSQNDGELVARVNNESANDFHCTNMSIGKAGNSSFTWYSDGISLHRVSDRIVRSVAATDNVISPYTIYMYLSEAQILSIELFSGLPRSQFKLYHTTSGFYTGANGSNTVFLAASYSAIPGVGGVFSATFTDGLTGNFAVGAALPASPLPVTCIDFYGVKANNEVQLKWKVGDETNNERFEIERSTDNRIFSYIGRVDANVSNGGVYRFTDPDIAGIKTAFYRLKQFDIGGSSKYTCTVLKVRMEDGDPFTIGPVYPNPGNENGYVNIFSATAMKIKITLINSNGQQVMTRMEQLQSGTTRVPIFTGTLLPGTYLARFSDVDDKVLSTQVYIRQ